MARYFLELSYKGTNYAGFQIQKNANTIQAEVEKAMQTLFSETFTLTGSSRTDKGVHAIQNYFHFDSVNPIDEIKIYNLNALLPNDIAIKNIFKVPDEAHCRFDAVSREYKYFVVRKKDPFLQETAFYYPYQLNIEKLNELAAIITLYKDFTSFSKKKTQVKSFICDIENSHWHIEKECLIFTVKANRFLRGMVRALVATMLKISRGENHMEEFKNILEAVDCRVADFSAAPQGLFLYAVKFNDFSKKNSTKK